MDADLNKIHTKHKKSSKTNMCEAKCTSNKINMVKHALSYQTYITATVVGAAAAVHHLTIN